MTESKKILSPLPVAHVTPVDVSDLSCIAPDTDFSGIDLRRAGNIAHAPEADGVTFSRFTQIPEHAPKWMRDLLNAAQQPGAVKATLTYGVAGANFYVALPYDSQGRILPPPLGHEAPFMSPNVTPFPAEPLRAPLGDMPAVAVSVEPSVSDTAVMDIAELQVAKPPASPSGEAAPATSIKPWSPDMGEDGKTLPRLPKGSRL